jgi:hypothetical protein
VIDEKRRIAVADSFDLLQIDDEESERKGCSGNLSGLGGGRALRSHLWAVDGWWALTALFPRSHWAVTYLNSCSQVANSQSGQRSCPSRGLPGTGAGT